MPADRKELVTGIYRATETGDVAILDRVLSADVIEHPLNPGQVRGRDSIKMIFGGLSSLVAELTLTNEDIISSGDRVAVRSTVAGIAIGPYLGVPPSDRPLSFEAIDIWRIADHRVVEGWHIEDFAGILGQWDLIAVPPSSTLATVAVPATQHDGTQPEAAIAVVSRWYEAVQRLDLEAAEQLVHQDFVSHGPIGPWIGFSGGRDAVIRDVSALHRAFPDIDIAVADLFAEENKVVARLVVRGTQLGDLPTIPATARRGCVMGHEIWTVAGGKLIEHWGRFEDLDLLQQLGVLAAPS